MKKYISYIMILVMVAILIGCGEKTAENVKEKDAFDLKAANTLVEQYLDDISSESYERANKVLLENVKGNVKDIQPNNLKIKGYRIEELNESVGEGNFRVKVVKSNIVKPEAQVLEYRIKVVKDGIDYKISEVNASNLKEVYKELDEIRLRKEDEVETYLLTNFKGLPKYAYAKGDNGKMNSEEVPHNEYGMTTLNYSGDLAAISTLGNGTYIGILSFDESTATQGSSPGGKQGEEGQEGQSGQLKLIKEKPIGQKFVSLDVIKGGKIENMVFSQDEKFIVIQYTKGEMKSIRVYEVRNGELIKTNFDEEYPLNKVNVIYTKFKKDKMLYKVMPKNDQEKNNEYVGDWELDLKTFKILKAK